MSDRVRPGHLGKALNQGDWLPRCLSVNGAVTTWRLPEVFLAFLHFTHLMQVVFVAVLGVVLSGIAALVGWRWGVKRQT